MYKPNLFQIFFLAFFILTSPALAAKEKSEDGKSDKEIPDKIQKMIDEHRKKWCHVTWDPKINIVPITDKVKYDYSLSTKELSTFHIDTDSPYDDDVITDVGGLMSGRINIDHEIELDEEYHDGLHCFFYKEINVEIAISPKVYIAKEYPKGTCMFDEIKKHENKHVLVDRKVVNKYAKKVGIKLVDLINEEMLVGPVREKDSQLATDYLRNKVKAEINYIAKQMYDERNRRQQLVDSLGEYQDVTDNCRER